MLPGTGVSNQRGVKPPAEPLGKDLIADKSTCGVWTSIDRWDGGEWARRGDVCFGGQ